MAHTIQDTIATLAEARKDALIGLRLALQAEQTQRVAMWRNSLRDLDSRIMLLVASVSNYALSHRPPGLPDKVPSRKGNPGVTDKGRPAPTLKDIRPFVRRRAQPTA